MILIARTVLFMLIFVIRLLMSCKAITWSKTSSRMRQKAPFRRKKYKNFPRPNPDWGGGYPLNTPYPVHSMPVLSALEPPPNHISGYGPDRFGGFLFWDTVYSAL